MAFQCRKVWKLILRSLGFCSVSASLLRVSRNVPFIDFREPGKMSSFFFGSALSISISPLLTLHILGLEPFSGVFSVIIRFSRSMSIHCSLFASPERMAVSFRTCAKAAFFLWDPAIRASSSCSVGMNGNLRVTSHFGFVQVAPLNFRNSVYALITFLLLFWPHFWSETIST